MNTGRVKRHRPFVADWPVRRGMLLAGVVAAACAGLSLCLPAVYLFGLAAVAALSLLFTLRRPVLAFVAVWAAVLLCLGGVYRVRTVEPMTAFEGQTDVVTVRVIALPTSGQMATVEVVAAEKIPRGTRVLLYCSKQIAPSVQDTLFGEVRYVALSASQQRYRADGVFLQAFPSGDGEDALALSSSPSVYFTMTALRERLIGFLRARIPTEEGALLAGLCLGDLRGVSTAVSDAFRDAGLTHILVVSGLHLSVISAGVFAVCRRLFRRRVAATVSMAVVFIFMLLVGFSPSVVRAGVACFVMLGGQLFHRRADGLNSLGLALTLLLAYNPYSLLDAGLQLSFGATAGVLCLYEPVYTRLCGLPLWKPLASAVAVTVAATLPILPLLAWLFGEVSVVSPLANVLAATAASVAMMLGCLGMLLSLCPLLAFLSTWLWYPAAWAVRWLLAVAQICADLPFATLSTVRLWILAYLTGGCGLGILCLYSKKRGMLRRALCALTVLALIGNGLATRFARDATRVAVSQHTQGAVLVIEHAGRYAVVVQAAADIYTDRVMRGLCHDGVDFLIIGSGACADAARLPTFLRQIPAERVLVGGDAGWLTGLSVTVESLPPSSPFTLWDGVTLSVSPDGAWCFRMQDTDLVLSPCGDSLTADGAIFVGGLPENSEQYAVKQGVLLTDGTAADALAVAQSLPYPVTAVTDERIYLTTRGNGEWSITQWL